MAMAMAMAIARAVVIHYAIATAMVITKATAKILKEHNVSSNNNGNRQ